MKKQWIIGAVVAVAIASGVVILTNLKKPGQGTVTIGGQKVKIGKDADAGSTKTACQLMTDDIGRKILGPNARKSDTPSSEVSASTEGISFTTCLYDNGSEDPAKLQSASIVVRAVKQNKFLEENKSQFTLARNPKEIKLVTEDVLGLGDKAYWNQTSGAMNAIVKGGQYWIMASVGLGTTEPTAEGKAASLKLTQEIINNL